MMYCNKLITIRGLKSRGELDQEKMDELKIIQAKEMAEIERDACKKFYTSVRFLKQVWMKQFSADSLIQTHQ